MNRRDAEAQRGKGKGLIASRALLLSLCLCASAVNLSCGSKPSDMRSLVPADALIYLESNDLGAAIQPIIDSKPFNDVANYKPDLSAIKGVQLAVAVTGFEMAEEKLSDEQSVGNIKPHFVAIADTHAWNWQAVSFAEKKLGSFVADIYDSEPSVVRSDKSGGTYFTWTALDGRKAFALVRDGLIYFGNDESSIDKCLAVRRGEADSIAKAGKVLAAEPGTLASGYVGPDGIAQLANIIGLKLAAEASEESEVQSAIAAIVPQLLRSSITAVTWTARQTDLGTEDSYLISVPNEMANPLANAMAPLGQISIGRTGEFAKIPADAYSVTLYNFKSPATAWQSLISLAQTQGGQTAGAAIGEFANLLLEPYGVSDAQLFLKRLDRYILTARLDDTGESSVMIAPQTDNAAGTGPPLTSLLEQNVRSASETGGDVYNSDDGDLTAVIGEDLILGDKESVSRCQLAQAGRENFSGLMNGRFMAFDKSTASVLTFVNDGRSASQIANLLSAVKRDGLQARSASTTQTTFSERGMERRTISDFGLIGTIIAQLSSDQSGM